MTPQDSVPQDSTDFQQLAHSTSSPELPLSSSTVPSQLSVENPGGEHEALEAPDSQPAYHEETLLSQDTRHPSSPESTRTPTISELLHSRQEPPVAPIVSTRSSFDIAAVSERSFRLDAPAPDSSVPVHEVLRAVSEAVAPIRIATTLTLTTSDPVAKSATMSTQADKDYAAMQAKAITQIANVSRLLRDAINASLPGKFLSETRVQAI